MDLVGHVDEISRSVIQGWVIDTERPDTTITLSIFVNDVHRGMCLTTHARDDLLLPNGERLSGKCGFHFEFEPPLSPFVELRIDVVETWSGQVLRNGSRVLPRPGSHDGDGKGMIPVLLTSTGRTGTTLLMSEFARHPDLVVGDQFPYEIKQIAYHAAAFRALVADADWERSTKPETMLSAEMRNIIGSNPYKMSGLFGLGGGRNALRSFYHSEVPTGYATLFRQFIVDFYATLANAQGKQSAPYFCEKGDLDEAAVLGARLFFDRVKDIVIVRDPRDLLCSAIAFWKLRPDGAMAMLASTVSRLARIARHAGPDTIVIRYEDLVREPVPTRRALSRFLDLDLLSQLEAETEAIPDSHRTSSDPAASIGRWRNDLTPHQIEACEVVFGTLLRDYNYELSAPSGRRDHRRSTREPIVAAEGKFALAAFAENYAAESEDGSTSRQVLELIFGRDGTGEMFTREGWAPAERGFVWSNAAESRLLLPPIRGKGKYRFHITASPFTHGTALPAQRVTILLNGHAAGTAEARETCVLSIPVPAAVARSARTIELTLRFPDAARPSEVLGSDDKRMLGISLHRIALFQTEVVEAAVPGKPVRRPRGAVAPGSKADILQPGPRENSDLLVVSRLAEVMREAFRQPRLDYLTPTVLRKIAGYDATSFVRFVLALEAEFGLTLQEHEVDQIETMGDVLALVRGKLPVITETVLPEMAK
jgi:acyl carrier protein